MTRLSMLARTPPTRPPPPCDPATLLPFPFSHRPQMVETQVQRLQPSANQTAESQSDQGMTLCQVSG